MEQNHPDVAPLDRKLQGQYKGTKTVAFYDVVSRVKISTLSSPQSEEKQHSKLETIAGLTS
jgi:hypothetical protein